MNGSDWGNIIAAFGPVGGLVIAVIVVLAKTGFLSREDPSRGDVIAKLEKMDDKMDVVRDRLTALEAETRGLSRRVDRMDK